MAEVNALGRIVTFDRHGFYFQWGAKKVRPTGTTRARPNRKIVALKREHDFLVRVGTHAEIWQEEQDEEKSNKTPPSLPPNRRPM